MTSTTPPAPCAGTSITPIKGGTPMAFSLVALLIPAVLILAVIIAVIWISHR